LTWLATRQGVRVAKDTSYKQLRPYIAVVSCKLTKCVIKDQIYVTVKIENNGQTPAKNAMFYWSIDLGDDQCSPLVPASMNGRRINPNQTRRYTPRSHFSLTGVGLKSILSKQTFVRIRFRVDYSDFSGERHVYFASMDSNRRHITGYRIAEHEMMFDEEEEYSEKEALEQQLIPPRD